jgi:hypothetical protein
VAGSLFLLETQEKIIEAVPMTTTAMGSSEERGKRVSTEIRDNTVSKGKVVERGIAKWKKTAYLSGPSTPKTVAESETVCSFSSKVTPDKVFSEDVNEESYNDEIRNETVTEQNLNDTAVTCDETFEVSFEECDARKEGALLVEGLEPDQELAAERVASENGIHVRQLPKEGFFPFFDDQKSFDSGSFVFPGDDVESTMQTLVSTKVTCKELDEEEAVERDCEIKSQMTSPKRDAVKAEPKTTTTIDMTNAPNPTDSVENFEDFTSMISKSISTLSEGVRHVFGINWHESKQDEPKQENQAAPQPNVFCVDPKAELAFMGMLPSTFADILNDEHYSGSHGLERNTASSKDNDSLSLNCSVNADDSFTWTDSFLPWNSSLNDDLNTSNVDSSITWNDILNEDGSVTENAFMNERLPATDNDDQLQGNVNFERKNVDYGSVDDNASINEKPSATDYDNLLQGTATFKEQNLPKAGTSKRKLEQWKRQKRKNDPSHPLAPGYSDPGWESASPQVENDDTIVDTFPDDEDPIHNVNVKDTRPESVFAAKTGKKSGAEFTAAGKFLGKKAVPLNDPAGNEEQLLEASGPLEGMPKDGWAVSAMLKKGMDDKSARTLGAKAVNATIPKITTAVADDDDDDDRTSKSVSNGVGDYTSRTEAGVKRSIVKFKSLLLHRNKSTIPKITAAVADDDDDRTSKTVSNGVGDYTSRTEAGVKRGIVKFKSLLLHRNKSEMPTMLKAVEPGRQIENKAGDWQSAVDPNYTSRTEAGVKCSIVKFKSLLLHRNKSEMPTILKTVEPVRKIDNKAGDWQSAVDPNTEKTYYFHRFTRETTWEMPSGFMKVTNGDRAEPKVSKALKKWFPDQYRTRSNVTGASTSTDECPKTDDEAASLKLGKAGQSRR